MTDSRRIKVETLIEHHLIRRPCLRLPFLNRKVIFLHILDHIFQPITTVACNHTHLQKSTFYPSEPLSMNCEFGCWRSWFSVQIWVSPIRSRLKIESNMKNFSKKKFLKVLYVLSSDFRTSWSPELSLEWSIKIIRSWDGKSVKSFFVVSVVVVVVIVFSFVVIVD